MRSHNTTELFRALAKAKKEGLSLEIDVTEHIAETSPLNRPRITKTIPAR
ncbi:MAG: hypothetical protein V3W41_19375 [Planctomycetota bacterium]